MPKNITARGRWYVKTGQRPGPFGQGTGGEGGWVPHVPGSLACTSLITYTDYTYTDWQLILLI